MIADAQSIARVEAETISYVEAHGTGTALGDPIGSNGAHKGFPRHDGSERFLWHRFGENEPGSSRRRRRSRRCNQDRTCVASQLLPPSLHFQTPNPRIDFENSPHVVSKPAYWKNGNGPRRAAVSSFGIGGTNAHAILEEAPARDGAEASEAWQLLIVSAKTLSALDHATANLVEHLRKSGNQFRRCRFHFAGRSQKF